MSQFRVEYSLNTDYESSNGFSSDSTVNNLEMVVEAIGQSQAQGMVEAIFGGPQRIYIKRVVPIF